MEGPSGSCELEQSHGAYPIFSIFFEHNFFLEHCHELVQEMDVFCLLLATVVKHCKFNKDVTLGCSWG